VAAVALLTIGCLGRFNFAHQESRLADRHKTKSPYSADRDIPGAFEGETVSRRRFMVGSVHVLGATAAAAFTLPALGFAIGPLFEKRRGRWEDVGAVNDFSDFTYVPRVITTTVGIGEVGKTTVYIRKRNEGQSRKGASGAQEQVSPPIDTEKADRYNQYIAISTRCMHLGCPVRFIQASQRFVCPCHGGVYDFQGKVSGGPPVRPLDRFYTRVTGEGRLEVGPRYSVNSELKRFSPRDPGEDLDGIGPYLYPPRFSTPNKP
jgi:menaquinol-cytochrome c reductase iron-sulfur subunit